MAQDFSQRYIFDRRATETLARLMGIRLLQCGTLKARMAKISQKLLADIDKDYGGFYANFDESLKEPTVLPSRFPNLLVNGSSGICSRYGYQHPPSQTWGKSLTVLLC